MSDDKIDKAIERTVMDWLQWHTFEDHPDYAQHTLTLISRLKAERDSILKEADRLAEALEFYDDEIYHYYGLNQQPEVLQDRGDHANLALTHYRNFKKGMK